MRATRSASQRMNSLHWPYCFCFYSWKSTQREQKMSDLTAQFERFTRIMSRSVTAQTWANECSLRITWILGDAMFVRECMSAPSENRNSNTCLMKTECKGFAVHESLLLLTMPIKLSSTVLFCADWLNNHRDMKRFVNFKVHVSNHTHGGTPYVILACAPIFQS